MKQDFIFGAKCSLVQGCKGQGIAVVLCMLLLECHFTYLNK